ncbi:hypothetical protein [Mangrovibacillus cuniculi]|uniref:Uncharacterized protein n=1 Tax=Mangrovibacillus cuniculi TaxID=2593652 RepID=A0A7S8HG39_9BACI|nr:hypothetical protein [Mangrovibacillus cuniculi]QPC47584.1 hypothetical protein G8O30_11785 [Mangrovibacillus cuniculi]
MAIDFTYYANLRSTSCSEESLENFLSNEEISQVEETCQFELVSKVILEFYIELFLEQTRGLNNLASCSNCLGKSVSKLSGNLYEIVTPAVIYFLQELVENNRLVGNTCEERYQYFIENFYAGKRFHFAFFERNPVIREKVVTLLSMELSGNKSFLYEDSGIESA